MKQKVLANNVLRTFDASENRRSNAVMLRMSFSLKWIKEEKKKNKNHAHKFVMVIVDYDFIIALFAEIALNFV